MIIRLIKLAIFIAGLVFLYNYYVSVSYGQEVIRIEFGSIWDTAKIRTVCINKYLFVVAKTKGDNGISIVQIFKDTSTPMLVLPPVPIKCKG